MPLVTAVTTALGAGLSAAAGTVASIGTAVGTTAAGLGTAASLAGTGASVYGQIQAGEASREAEKIRRTQMRVSADRERRQTIRSAMQARATANTAGMAQGASFGSGVAGGQAQVYSDAAQRVGDTNLNQGLGESLFDANARMSQGRSIASIGEGAANFGKQLFANQDAISRLAQQPFAKNPNQRLASPFNNINNPFLDESGY